MREEDETFQLRLGSSIGYSFKTIGTSNKALATIADDDRIPPAEAVLSLSHNGSALESVPEASTQKDITVTASFPRIRWPGDAADAPLRPADPRDVDTTVRVQFDPNSGATHAAGLDDFEPFEVEDDQGDFGEVESFDIAIPAGQTSGTATLRFGPVNDDVDEEDETVTLLGSEVVAGDSADSLPVRSASFTISDDDTRGITVSPSSALSGLSLVEAGEPGTYSLVLDSQPTDTVVITLAGNQGGFLRIVPDSITFTTSDWATPQTVSVMALDDGIAGGAPPTNSVTHQVSGGDYGSETVPDISASIEDTTEAYVYLEGGKASESDGHVEFTVTVRPVLRTTPVLVRYTTVDGTAMAGSDYTREVETGQTYKILTIPASQSSAAIRIPVTDDQVYESADETFTLQLTNHNNKATLDGDATSLTATGTIADDDPKPVVSVAGPAGAVSYVSENVKDPVTFTLTLTGQSAGDVTVDYATGEAGVLGLFTARQGLAGATGDEDYADTSGTVTFTSGQTTKTVTVQVTNDDVSEETEFFGFTISMPQGADLRGQRSEDVVDVGLLDDDRRGVTIDPTSIGLDEPASGETAVAGAYTVNLDSKPTDTATVTIGGSDPAVSLSGDTLTNNQLTFTTANWKTAQTITVTPVKDDNAAGETITLTHTLSGGDYAGIAADSVTVNVTDSDTRNIVLSKESLTVPEGDATGDRYTVELATQPSDSVSVSITGHSGTDLTLSGTTLTSNALTFTTANWGTAQTVTVKAGDDDNADNESETLTHTASGGDYFNVTKDLPVSITDDDETGIVLSETSLTVEEGDSAGKSYTVRLASRPSDTVIVTISGHDGTDLSLDKTSLTFTTANWDTAQTVTVKAAQDTDAADDAATLTHSASGGGYGSVSENLDVTVDDDETPDIVLSETEFEVEEEDATGASYTVRLSHVPTAEVTVTVTGQANTGLSLSGLSSNALTFTTANWDTAQTVTVKAGQDADAADESETLTHTASGGEYAEVSKDLAVTITDDDERAIVLSETSLEVDEGDSAGESYTVRLASRPTAGVTVTVTGQANTDLSLSGLSSNALTFTTANWDTAQTVTVKAGQDADAADETATLTHTGAGGDYAGLTADLPVTVDDDETPGIVLNETALEVEEEDATGTSYTVKLSHVPTTTVTVTVSGHSGTDVELGGLTSGALTFTTANWGTAQTVTVKAGADADAADDRATLTHSASGGEYAGVSKDLPVTVTDDDETGIVLSETSLEVDEGDSAGESYTVRLATQPTAGVTVTVTGQANTDLSLSGLSSNALTFTTANWDTAQTVTVKAADDPDDNDETAILTHTGAGGDYAGLTADLPVTVADDAPDTVAVSFGAAAYSVTEDDEVEVTVSLDADPERTVVILLTASNEGGASGSDYSGVPANITFESGETSGTFTLAATADSLNESGEQVKLGFGTLPDDATEGSPKESVVSISDKTGDQGGSPTPPTAHFENAAYSVAEGASVAVKVKLSKAPGSEVSVPVTKANQAGADYSGVPESVVFGATDTEKSITFAAADDSEDDDGEEVLLGFGTLPNGISGTTGEASQATVSITDDDHPRRSVSFERASYSVAEGESVAVKVVLSGDPERAVSIPITRSNQAGATDADYSGVPASVAFDSGETEQTFTLAAVQDDLDDDGEGVKLGFGSELPEGISEGATKEAVVSITDDDERGIVLSETSLEVEEGDSAGESYTVRLASRPTAGVTVTVTGQANTDLSLSGLSSNALTFTTANWDTAQTVTVKAAQDDDAADDTAVLTHSASGGGYGSVSETLPVTVDDDDTPGIVLNKTALEVVEEDATGASYTVRLSHVPTTEVTVTVGGHSGTDLELSGLSSNALTFTTANWDTAQTVTVTAAQDDDAADDTVTLTHTASGGEYAGVKGELSVTVTDDDETGIVLSETSLKVDEGDSAGESYTVRLATQPTAGGTVTVTGQANTDLSLSGLTSGALTFTTSNWDTAQTVTVKAADDPDAADETVTLTHTAGGGEYAGVKGELSVTVTDDDEKGIVLSETSLEVDEGDASGTSYTVKLSHVPTTTVTVTVSGHSGTDVTLNKQSLTFTTSNWDTAQSVTVTAAQDDDAADDTVTLTHTAGGGEYASVSDTVAVTVDDDDAPALVLSESAVTVTEGDASGTSYTVKLSHVPTTTVTVTVSGHSGTDVTLNKQSLTFTTSNWDTAQSVTVTAAQDDDAADDTVTLTHTAGGGEYASVSKTLAVTVDDDDAPALVLSESAVTVTEGDASGTSYTVKLSHVPTTTVTVTVSGHSGTDVTLNKQSLTFTTSNWDTAQSVTVTAAQDDDAADDTVTLTHTAGGGEYASVYDTLAATVDDDDAPALVLSESAVTVTEGDASGTSYTVKLSHVPTTTVTVTVSGHSGTDVTLNKQSLTFTTSNWDTAQSVTVTAAQDDDAADDTVTLTHTAGGGEYASVSDTLAVTVDDDDAPALVLSESAVTVTEGDATGTSYTVKLSHVPTTTVTVAVSGHSGTDVTLDKASLTFTTSNWNTAQSVAVTAAQDDDAADDTVTLTHTASGGEYASVSDTLAVTVDDDDTAGVRIDPAALTLLAGDANSYSVVLTSEPASTVTVSVSGHANTDVS